MEVGGGELPAWVSGQLPAMAVKCGTWGGGNETRNAGRATGDRGGARLRAIIALATVGAWSRRESRLGYPSGAQVAGESGAVEHSDRAQRCYEQDRKS